MTSTVIAANSRTAWMPSPALPIEPASAIASRTDAPPAIRTER